MLLVNMKRKTNKIILFWDKQLSFPVGHDAFILYLNSEPPRAHSEPPLLNRLPFSHNLCRVTFCKMSICLICLPPHRRALSSSQLNTDGLNCCRNWGEHLYGRDLMYPIAIISPSHMETILLRVFMQWQGRHTEEDRGTRLCIRDNYTNIYLCGWENVSFSLK